MEIIEIIKAIFQYGGTIIMAGLFVWLFFWVITRMNETLKEINTTLKTLAVSEENLSKTIDIISQKLTQLDQKSDRNYLEIKKGEKRD